MKRQDNDMIDRINVISLEYDTELSRPIRQCAFHDKDETRQQHD